MAKNKKSKGSGAYIFAGILLAIVYVINTFLVESIYWGNQTVSRQTSMAMNSLNRMNGELTAINTDCIGIFDAEVKRFQPKNHEDKVPCMGWNQLYDIKSPLYNGLNDGDYVYFVHSFFVPICAETIATADDIQPYSASRQKALGPSKR